MQDKIGQKFTSTIVSVMGFGLFVSLHETYVEGLVHITSLPNDYYHFDPVYHQLVGERTGEVYKVGDELTVRLIKVDLNERNIDFDLIENKKRKKQRGK